MCWIWRGDRYRSAMRQYARATAISDGIMTPTRITQTLTLAAAAIVATPMTASDPIPSASIGANLTCWTTERRADPKARGGSLRTWKAIARPANPIDANDAWTCHMSPRASAASLAAAPSW